MATTTYCSESDITDRKGTAKIAELTGDPQGTTVDSTKVTSAIEEFAEKLNAAVRNQYPDLPFDSTNKLLNGLNIQGAFLLLVRDSETGWSEDDREEWKMLLKEVDAISEGRGDLRTETEDEEEALTDPYFSSNKAVFGRDKGLRSWDEGW